MKLEFSPLSSKSSQSTNQLTDTKTLSHTKKHFSMKALAHCASLWSTQMMVTYITRSCITRNNSCFFKRV